MSDAEQRPPEKPPLPSGEAPPPDVAPPPPGEPPAANAGALEADLPYPTEVDEPPECREDEPVNPAPAADEGARFQRCALCRSAAEVDPAAGSLLCAKHNMRVNAEADEIPDDCPEFEPLDAPPIPPPSTPPSPTPPAETA